MRYWGHVSHLGLLVEKPKGKRPLGISRSAWKNNIKMGLK